MTNTLNRRHLDYVSSHINQTHLVNELFCADWGVCPDDIEGLEHGNHGECPEIFQWLAFTNFYGPDYDLLIGAGIPVLDSDYGTWVGITSFGSPYDLYVYPELIRALFGIECSYEDIEHIRKA